jgi:hypothetical protein
MDDTSDDSLRRRLSAVVGPADASDWAEVARLAQIVKSPRRRTLRLSRLAMLTHRRMLAVALGFAAVLAPPAFAVGYFVLRSSPAVLATVTVPSLPTGWTVLTSGPYVLRPDGTHAYTIITSWRYRSSPEGPASEIPPGGILISVALLRGQTIGARINLCETAPTLSGYPRRTPPLTLPKTTTDTLDGAPHVKEFRVFGRYRNFYNFEVRADIDTRRQLGPRWSAAETVVRGLRFPAWPMKRTC